MQAEYWNRIKAIFSDAGDQPPGDREVLLTRACGGDSTLEGDVRRLLEEETKSPGFLDRPIELPPGMFRLLETAAAAFQPGDCLSGRFRIRRLIARGGMGEVYEAFDQEVGEKVALKTIRREIATHPELIRLFRAEVRRARHIVSPYVCRVYDLFVERTTSGMDAAFLTMELLEGETLSQRLVRESALHPSVATRLLAQVAEGLKAIHEAGVVHGDLKSGNIMVVGAGERQRAVIMDFGLAHALPSHTSTADPSSRISGRAGTPAYMAPEQHSEGKITARSDIYSVGVIGWELLTGKVPFRAGDRGNEPLPMLRPVVAAAPRRLETAVRRCLELEPRRRFASATDLLVHLNPPRRHWFAAAVLAILLVSTILLLPLGRQDAPPPDSLAVLPLTAADGSAEPEYFRDGLTEELIDALAGTPRLRVLARESSFRYRTSGLLPHEIGRRLGVAAVVAGSLERSNGRLRLKLRLVTTDRGYGRWSRVIDRPEAELPAIKAEVADGLVGALNLQAAPRLGEASARPSPATEARDLYFLGRFHWNKRGDDDLFRAKESFERALAIQPDYALALVGLADAHAVMAERHSLPPAQALATAKDMALRALAIDPLLPDAHASLGFITSVYDRDFDLSEQYFRRALDLNPNLATGHQWYSYALIKLRRWEEAERYARKALEIDPLSLPANGNLGVLLHYRGDHERAIQQCRRLLEMNPRHMWARPVLAQHYARLGRRGEALRELAAYDSLPADHPLRLRLTLEAQALLGQFTEAERNLHELVRRYDRGDVPASYVAFAFAALNHRDEAFEWSERAYRERDGMISLIHAYPACESLRADRRYADLLRRLGIKEKTERGSVRFPLVGDRATAA